MKAFLFFCWAIFLSICNSNAQTSYSISTSYTCASVGNTNDKVGFVVEQVGSNQLKFYLIKLKGACSNSPSSTFPSVNTFTVYESTGAIIGSATTRLNKGYSNAVNYTLPTSFTNGKKYYYAKLLNVQVGNLVINAVTNPILNISPTSLNLAASKGQASVTVTSNTSWSVTNDSPNWINSKVSSSSGNQIVLFDYSSNTNFTTRIARLIFKTATLTKELVLTQAGFQPSLALSTNSVSIPATQTTSSVGVNANTNWTVTSSSSWITLGKTSGQGNLSESIEFKCQANVLPNASTAPRSGKLIFNARGLIKELIVNQSGVQAPPAKIEIAQKITVSSGSKQVYTLITGLEGKIFTTVKNTGGSDWNGKLSISLYDPQNNSYLSDIDTFTGTLKVGESKTLGKLSGSISSYAGVYKVVSKKYENNAWITLQEQPIDILPSGDFTKQDMSKFKGISLYRNIKGDNIFVLDLRDGATLDFLLSGNTYGGTAGSGSGVGSTVGTPAANCSANSYARETIQSFFDKSKKSYSKRIVATLNGQYFDDPNNNLPLPVPICVPLQLSVYSKGKQYGNTNSTLPASIPSKQDFSPLKQLSIENNKAKVRDIYKIDKANKQWIKFTDLGQPYDGIVGYTINAEGKDNSCNIPNNEAKTLIGLIDTDNNVTSFEKIIIVIVGDEQLEKIATSIFKPFGVRVNKVKSCYVDPIDKSKYGSYIEADIIQLDGGGSSQLFGYNNNFERVEFKKSSDYNDIKQVSYGSAPRKIPQAISILCGADYNNPNARLSSTDSLISFKNDEQKFEQEELLSVYPNPSKNGLVTVTYKIPEAMDADKPSILVSNLLGQVLYQQSLSQTSGSIQFNLSREELGYYLIRLQVGEYWVSKRLLLER